MSFWGARCQEFVSSLHEGGTFAFPVSYIIGECNVTVRDNPNQHSEFLCCCLKLTAQIMTATLKVMQN